MPDPERLKRDTLLLASQVWTVGCGVMKRRVYISLPEVGGVCKGLERESVLGTYCLRVAGKRKGDVFRRRQAEQEWGWKYEQSWQGWRKETVTAGAPLCSLTTQHWTLETSGESVMGSQLLESSCACVSRGCSSLSRASQVGCSVSKYFFHPTESSREAAD